MGCVAFSACSSSNDDMEVIPENKDLLHISVMQEDNESGVLWEKGDIGLFVLGDDASLAVTNQLHAVSGGVLLSTYERSRYIAYAPYQERGTMLGRNSRFLKYCLISRCWKTMWQVIL